ncbi:MAG: hypothetical protein CVT80_08305 [Alphaproteobacteria bacterium HGW-Alphaproteobacteria-2]|nr:MAG: hypothetical protein CVT80_08305 [Alphaproteobacteria bacterium HGW-Alphaproteobacteria-2]
MPEPDRPTSRRLPWAHLLTRAAFARRKPLEFDLAPAPEVRAALAAELDLLRLPKLRFAGRLLPADEADWQLEARLGASVVQPCVVSLAPVKTRIEETVTRRFMAEPPIAPAGESRMPDDDETEPLPAAGLDLGAVMAEALALALPDYPRAPGAELPLEPPQGEGETGPLGALARLGPRTKN